LKSAIRRDGDVNRRIGITTTVPVEIIFAAGDEPVDLNNVFISQSDALEMVERAESAGYPANVCGWIKGIYSAVIGLGAADAVVAVTQGDCSNTQALMETLEYAGVEVVPFAFPYDRDRDMLQLQMEKFASALGTTLAQAENVRDLLYSVRSKLIEVDRLTWQEGAVTGSDNFEILVNSSDFRGDWKEFESNLDAFLDETARREPVDKGAVRLGYLGVPPILSDLHEVVEHLGVHIVYNEIPRQFSMPFAAENLVEQYAHYTYPYGIFARLEDIRAEMQRRSIDGVIHYAQSFCFRQIEDMILRKELAVPILTIEADKPGRVDARTRTRIEAFVEMLRKE